MKNWREPPVLIPREAPMSVALSTTQALRLMRNLSSSLVTDAKIEAAPDFTLRQLALFLTIYIDQPPHTVRGLAKGLGVTKPVVTRALDALGKHGLTARRRDERDARNVIVQRTVKGSLYVETLGDIIVIKASELMPAGVQE